jgi:GNAT superfamily N-acetyltransferase
VPVRIRRVTAEERLTLAFPLQAYAFDRSPTAAEDEERRRAYLPYQIGNTTLVAMVGDQPQAVATSIPMRQHVRGAVVSMAGIAGVATHPLARRRGHIRSLMTQLLRESHDAGHVVSALHPFRPSFYARFGYVGLPQAKRVTILPADLAPMLGTELPGEVRLERIKEGYAAYRAFTERLLAERHGMALFPDYRAVAVRDSDEHWLVTARADGELVAAAPYAIQQHGGDLVANEFLYTTPLGRALLLQFFARHVDQVARVVVTLAADDMPELWLTDLPMVTEVRTSFPHSPAPVARLLSVPGLAGIDAGPGVATVEVVDDPLLEGRYLLDGTTGKLEVAAPSTTEPSAAAPVARLTAAGLSALVYGVLDPTELVMRGLGDVPADTATQLAALFDRRVPFVLTHF